MPASGGERQLGVTIPAEAYDGLVAFADEAGATMTSVIIVLGYEAGAAAAAEGSSRSLRWKEVSRRARELAAGRRRRFDPDEA